jgi:hypothetical protein
MKKQVKCASLFTKFIISGHLYLVAIQMIHLVLFRYFSTNHGLINRAPINSGLGLEIIFFNKGSNHRATRGGQFGPNL